MKSVHFLSNQTFFLGKIRRPTESEILQYSEESINKSLSPDKLRLFSPSKKKFQDFFPYSCFANKTNTKIFLNNRCLSGNLLNRSLMKEDINNKIIFPEGDSYEFDQVLDENLRTKEFHQITTKPLAKGLLKGKSSSVLFYGAKRTGKTFLLRGNDKIRQGMLHNLLKELRLKLKPKMTEKTPTIFISIYLIYNNELYDLLKGKEKLATGTNNGFFDNLQKKSVEDKEDLELLLKQAINNRKILGSEINQPELKRKSHLIIRVQMSEENFKGEVNFVELADADFVNNPAIIPSEMDFINRDFNELLDSIVSSYTNVKKQNFQKKGLLLQCLRESLNLNSKLLMICCLSPSLEDFKSNKQSLKFTCDLRNLIRSNGEIPLSKRKINRFKTEEDSLKLKKPISFQNNENIQNKVKGITLIPNTGRLSSLDKTLTNKDLTKESSKFRDEANTMSIKSSPKKMSNAEKTSLSPHYYKNKKPNTSPKTKHSFITPKQTDFFSNNLSQKTIYSKDLQAHGKELRDKKSRIFDLLDREEELILSQDIDDLKREDLLKEYKVLYYKSKEQKTLLNEFAINNKEYQKELVEKTKKTDELNKELKKMMEELKFKERKHAETKEHFENLNFHNDKKEEEYDKNKRKSKELAEEYEKIKEKLILLQDENKRLKEQQKYSEEIKNFINKKEEKIQEYISEIKGKNQEIFHLQEALRDSEQNLLEHKERILRLERNSDSIVTDNREMKRIAEDKISKNQDYQEIIADLTEKLKEKELELQGKAEELVYYSAKAKEYRTKNKELEVEYSNLKSQKLALEQDIHLKYTNETINSSVMKDFLLEKAYLEKKLEEAISQRKALEHDILSKETQISEERRKNEYTDRKYRNEYDEFYKKTLKLAKENKELKEDLEQLAHKTALQEETLFASKKLNEEQEDKLDFLENKVNHTQSELFEVRKNFEEKIEKLIEENQFLKSNLEELKINSQELEKKNNELENAKEKHKHQANLLRFENKKMKETYGEKEKNLLKQFDEELKNKENILSNICDERDKILEKQRKKEQKLDVLNDIQSLISSHKVKLKK